MSGSIDEVCVFFIGDFVYVDVESVQVNLVRGPALFTKGSMCCNQ